MRGKDATACVTDAARARHLTSDPADRDARTPRQVSCCRCDSGLYSPAWWCRAARRVRPRFVFGLTHVRETEIVLLGPETWDGVEHSARAGETLRAVAETGVMPGTAHGVADQQSVSTRGARVRADVADREKLISASDKQQRFAAHVAGNHPEGGDRRDGDSSGEIGSRGHFVHVNSSIAV